MRLLALTLLLLTTPAYAEEIVVQAETTEVIPQTIPQSAIAIHGEPKYKDGFTHLDYVNPDAPKGGTIKLHQIGTFDSLNPFIVKGTPVAGMQFLGQSLVYDSLMEQSFDEPFSMYGLLAQSIERPESNEWVAFNLRPEAKWQDGKPVTPEDVIWSFNTFMEKGTPFFKAYYGDVTNVEKTSERRVKFTFKDGGNAELPLILSQLSILPKHYWEQEGKDFGSTSLEPPLGSGPYKITKVDQGRSITYTRDPNYWGKDLPINKGKFNFGSIEMDYYKDSNVALEAFFAEEYDYRTENVAKLWETGYDAAPVTEGRITKEEISHKRPQGMQGFIINARREIFKDPKVREALSYAFDFEWSNKQFAYGGYKRTDSFFENSELASTEGAPTGRVLEILEPYRGKIPDSVFTTRYAPPKTDGSGNARMNLRKAMQLLDEAGYKLGEDKIRVHETTGQRLEFEIVDANPLFERWVLPFTKNLERAGVKASFRVVDPAQYQNLMNEFDFDMTIGSIAQSSSPGNEQRDFWSSAKADMPGSRNYMGIKDPVIDELIEMIITAPNRDELVFRTRALDRVLLANHYVIPQWHIDYWRVAYWSKLGRPDNLSDLTPGVIDTWWVKPE
ncbi:MAG: extracellular solute-binding protein [Pseudomonadota bacterium]